MNARGDRIGLNEAVFREVNERIEDVAGKVNLNEELLDLVCECGDIACVERIAMTRSEYEGLRADPTHFAVASGHEDPDVEEVVEKRKGYDVVRKREGVPAAVARKTDPRT